MQPVPSAPIGPAPWQVPALAAVACAARLSLACCGLVLYAPDQHAVRRLMHRVVPLAAGAGTLALLSALAQRTAPSSILASPTGSIRLALDILLLGGWYVLALTALALARAYTLIAGGPLRLQPASRMGDMAGRAGRAPWTTGPSTADSAVPRLRGGWPLLFAILTAASLVLPLVVTGPAPHSPPSNGLMPDVGTSLLIVATNAAAAFTAHALTPTIPRASRPLLAVATLATALSLAYNVTFLFAR